MLSSAALGAMLNDRSGRGKAYIATTILFGIFAGLFSTILWNRSLERYEATLSTVASLEANAFGIYLQALERSMALLAAQIETLPSGDDPSRLLTRFKALYPEFEIVVLNDINGNVLHTSESGEAQSEPKVSLANDPSFIDAKDRLTKGASMVVSRVLYGPVSKKYSTPLRYGVRDAAGSLKYILGAGLSVNRPLEFWKNASVSADAIIGIIRDDYYLVARSPTLPAGLVAQYLSPTRGPVADHLEKHPLQQSAVFRAVSQITKVDLVVAVNRLERYPVYVFIAAPMKNVYAAWWSAWWPNLLVYLLQFALVMSAIYYIGHRTDLWTKEREMRLSQLEALSALQAKTNALLESRNSEKEIFMYSISHDLRAPIRAIDGYAALLAEDIQNQNQTESAAHLEVIRKNAKRMAQLLTDLVELARAESSTPDFTKIDVEATVQSAIAEGEFNLGNVKFKIETLPSHQGDQILIKQVWTNLISNAVKYSAKKPNPLIRIGFENGMYFVEDNGVGFEPTYKDKLFKLFSRLHADGDFSGTGIGLVIVKKLVELHGGHVDAVPIADGGSRFSFSIGTLA